VLVKAEIFSLGTELLMGELTDTNSAWMVARLPVLGIELQGVSIIGDSQAMITAGFTRALQRVDVILTTGGLGPSQDDLAREAIAASLQETPTVQEEALKELERYFQQRGRSMPAPNIKQAHLIPSVQFLSNPFGTAPGWWVERHGKIIVAMPGPPAEMHPMWDEHVEPRLRQLATGDVYGKRYRRVPGQLYQ
jgi:nicotinamide-nucleotide amidase